MYLILSGRLIGVKAKENSYWDGKEEKKRDGRRRGGREERRKEAGNQNVEVGMKGWKEKGRDENSNEGRK